MGGGAGWLQDPLPLPLGRLVDADADWRGVRERVIAVLEAEGLARGRAPSRYPVFRPVLTAGEIAGAGAQCGVTLPGGYRSFLAQAGAGGPGPHRGELRHRGCGVNPAFRPQADAHGNRRTFHTWYPGWLERRESQAASRSRILRLTASPHRRVISRGPRPRGHAARPRSRRSGRP